MRGGFLGATRRKFVRNREHLRAYEQQVILLDIAGLGGTATVPELLLRYPGRYHRPMLERALHSMWRDGHLTRRRVGFLNRRSAYRYTPTANEGRAVA